MSPKNMRRLVYEDLKMSSFTLQKRQALSAAVKQKRLERSKILLKKFKSGTAGEIVWSDEKILTVEMAQNRRNDKIIGRRIKYIPCDQKKVHRTMKPVSVMVWAKFWRCPLICVDQGAKIKPKCYVDNIFKTRWNMLRITSAKILCEHSNKMAQHHTPQTSPKIGVETIFQIFGPKKRGLHAPRILIP